MQDTIHKLNQKIVIMQKHILLQMFIHKLKQTQFIFLNRILVQIIIQQQNLMLNIIHIHNQTYFFIPKLILLQNFI